MRTKHLFFSSLPAALALAVFSAPIPVNGQYRLTPIEPNDPESVVSFVVYDFNNKSEAVGTLTRRIGDQFLSRPFLWRDGRVTELRVPDDDDPLGVKSAFAINDRSEIVGLTGGRMFFWRHGRLRLIPQIPGEILSAPADINNRRQIIGFTGNGTESRLFLLDGESVTFLEAPYGSDRGAVSLNDLGEVVGDVYTTENGFLAAALWQDGAVMPIIPLPGATFSTAWAINERSQTVGGAYMGALDGTTRAFIWHEGQASQLPFPSSEHRWATAYSINNCGDAVGSSFGEAGGIPVLWRQGTALNLNDQIVPDDPLKAFVTLGGASEINDSGRIIAFDSQFRYYLLTPVFKAPRCHAKGAQGE